MKKLNSKHRTVARYMALNPMVPLADICGSLGLNYGTWKVITRSDLFLTEVRRIQEAVEEADIEEALNDPIRDKLKLATHKAAERLIEEVDNLEMDQGANASTRIKAAESILSKCGYNNGEGNEKTKVVINIDSSKAELLQDIEAPEVSSVPDRISGHDE